MGSFAKQLATFEGKTEAKMELAMRKIFLEMFSRVILKTPVDTGRMRGNWQIAVGAVPTGTLELDDKTGSASIGAVQAAALGLRVGDTIYLANNLPYAMRLEEGSSQQAPAGMVALTVQEFKAVAAKIGIELSSQ